jgi:hypothetical protein
VKNFFLEIGPIGYHKIENFMLISKMQTCLSEKCPPKKLKLKKEKKWDLANLENSFFNFNFFWGHFFTKNSLLF